MMIKFIMTVSFYLLSLNICSAEVILSFAEDSIPVFDSNGEYSKTVPSSTFGPPEKMQYKGRGKNDFLIFSYGSPAKTVLLDEMYLELDPERSEHKPTVVCLEKTIRNKDFDYTKASTTGIGECP